MLFISKNELRYMQFPALLKVPGIWHGVFTRHFVGRDGHQESFNLGLTGNDPESEVWRRRRRVMAAAGANGAVFAHQVHGTEVAVWEGQSLPDGPTGGNHVRLSGDALITAEPGVALFIQTADCQSVLMFDAKQHIVANVHSGWRGSIGNIIGKTIATMVARYRCRPQDLHCAIGPSLGPCCAEFIHFRSEIPEQFWGYRRDGDLFDFWRISVDQLSAAGVPGGQIAVSGLCTRCNRQLFFSYRGEGGHTGRFATAISLIH